VYYFFIVHFRKQILKLLSFLALQRDDMEAIPGYLSLHQTAHIMTLKWTPNQLMNGSVGDLDYEHRWGEQFTNDLSLMSCLTYVHQYGTAR
jgi:hypothetical protein